MALPARARGALSGSLLRRSFATGESPPWRPLSPLAPLRAPPPGRASGRLPLRGCPASPCPPPAPGASARHSRLRHTPLRPRPLPPRLARRPSATAAPPPTPTAASRPALSADAAAPKEVKYNVDATNFEIAPTTTPWKQYKNEYYEKRGFKVAPKDWKEWSDLPAPYKYYGVKVNPTDVENPGAIWKFFRCGVRGARWGVCGGGGWGSRGGARRR